jgi:hypothetical protein
LSTTARIVTLMRARYSSNRRKIATPPP